LCELRLLASARFDSQPLLCVVLAGDARLIEKLRREELIPLGSRIRTRLATEHASRGVARLPDPSAEPAPATPA
jgi:general secretion pathway protein A